MALCRSDDNWTLLISEYNVCKQKLQSKRESVKIVMKELEQAQIEKDVYKNKARQLQRDFDELKAIIGDSWNNNDGKTLKFNHNQVEKKVNTLTNLLQYSQDENGRLKTDLESIKLLYNESQKDNILLRNTLSKHENIKKIGANGIEDKEKLIAKLEESLSKIALLENELQQMRDEREELKDEIHSTKEKNTRLNAELNYVLHNDEKRIVDIDTFVLENQYLKEVIKQYKEEKNVASNVAARYKEALKQKQETFGKKRLSYLDLSSPTNGQKNDGFFSRSFSQNTMCDLQRVNKALTEKVSDKELALKHQRNTNRILGTRVHELEKKLKTLEISGLWSHEQRVPRNISEEDFSYTVEGMAENKSIDSIGEGVSTEKENSFHHVKSNPKHNEIIEDENFSGLNRLSPNSLRILEEDGL